MSVRKRSTIRQLTHDEIFVKDDARIVDDGERQSRVEVSGVEPPFFQPIVFSGRPSHQLTLKLFSVATFTTKYFHQRLRVGKVFVIDQRL